MRQTHRTSMTANQAITSPTLSNVYMNPTSIVGQRLESAENRLSDFRVLQANARKSREGQEALFNDARLRRFGAIAMQEPHCFTSQDGKAIVTPVSSSVWIQHLPTKTSSSRWPVRSCLWTHKDIRTTQIPVQSHDLTAILLHLHNMTVLLVSVYIPPIGTAEWGPPSRLQDSRHLQHRVRLLRDAVNSVRALHAQVEVLRLGDFNRHDHLWGGDGVATSIR